MAPFLNCLWYCPLAMNFSFQTGIKKVPKKCHFLRQHFLTLIYELNNVCFSSLTSGTHKNQLQAENSIANENLSTYFSFVAVYNKF